MKITELITERRQQNISVVYHGTSSNFVRSILKTGLSPVPPKRSWGDSDKMGADKESLPGIYLTPRLDYAQTAAKQSVELNGGTPTLITVQYVSGSGGLDEDNITGIVCYAVSEDYDAFIKDFDHQFLDIISRVKDRLKNTALNNRSIEILKQLVKVAVNITSKNYEEVQGTEFRSILSNPQFRQLLIKFTESVKVHSSENPDWTSEHIKVTRIIGFSGKTKIVKIEDLKTKAVYYEKHEVSR